MKEWFSEKNEKIGWIEEDKFENYRREKKHAASLRVLN